MSNQINQTIRRVQRYWYEDGLVEIVIGLLFTVTGGFLFIQWAIPPGSALMAVAASLMLLVLILGGVAIHSLLHRLKEHITFPRTGYVEHNHKAESALGRWLIVGFCLALSALTIVAGDWFGSMASVAGLILGAVLAYLGYHNQIKRFYPLAVLVAVVGVAAGRAGLGDALGGVILFGISGLALLASGVITLTNYLRHNPAPVEE